MREQTDNTDGKHSNQFDSGDRPWTDEATLRSMYREMSMRDIADELNCDHSTVVRWMDEFGIERMGPGESTRERDSLKGKNHPNWRGGTYQKWRKTRKWKRTSRAVRERAGHECESCGDDGNLHAHHIEPVCEGGERFKMSNLMALCPDCHWGAHY